MRLPPLLHGKSSEIRGSLAYTILGRLIGSALWILSATCRYRITFHFDRELINKPCIFSLWHNRILCAPGAWMQLASEQAMGFLTSASKDGSLVSEALAVFGLKGVRGSSSRRGVAALMKMRSLMEEGSSITMTPDGPKGPLYKIKEGMLKLAQISKYPVLPVSISYTDCWRLKTWDGMCIPKPFSTIHVHLQEMVFLPESLTEDDFSEYSARIEAAMSKGCPDFEQLNSDLE